MRVQEAASVVVPTGTRHWKEVFHAARREARSVRSVLRVPELAIAAGKYRVSRNPENPAGRTSAADGAARRDRGRDGPSPDWLQAAPRPRGQPKALRHRRRADR